MDTTKAEADFNEWEDNAVKMVAGRPICSQCGNPITDYEAYRNGPDWFDRRCWDSYVRDVFYVDLDEYLGED